MEDYKNPLIEEQSTLEIEKAISNDQNAIPYIPMSKLPSMGTVTPLSLSGETMQAQFKVIEDIPDIDEYLVRKLGYTSKYSLSQAFSAEQADAVALAVRQIDRGKGFILADMAGIGKGRVNAGVLRYAFVNGYLPIFITEASNLFSAIYRDIVDIGGIQTTMGGKMNIGYPLILNGYKSGGVEKTYDENGRKVVVKKASETGIINAKGEEVITAPKQSEIKKIVSGDSIKGYDYMMLTYSQLSGKSGKPKVDFLLKLINKLDGKVIVCMDECHNASGTKSDVGKSMTDIISLIKGVLFSSATFSKSPDNMYLYSLKTDVADSPLGTKKLIEVIKAGGERLTENLASNLVASQQMIRRERTFDNCNVEYNYMSDDEKVDLFSKYDNSIHLYKKLVDFFTTNDLFIEAKKKAVERFAASKKVEVTFEPMPRAADEQKKWRMDNEGKYKVYFSAGEVKRSQFQFIETLLFALKADFVANQTLSQLLDNQLENIRTIDKSVFKSNRKPVIAVRNTLESVYYNLGLEVGSEIEKPDFSMYVYSIALGALSGAVTLKEIKLEKDKKDSDEGKGKIIEDEISVTESDFADNGAAYKELLNEINAINLDIPLSPIDHIINKIESTPRPSWDMQHGGGSENFKVGEVTGRKFSLIKQPNGKYKLITNKKLKNKGATFKEFNNGNYDVLLINESGSTGEDAHSSSKFKDQRPRVMIIHQVELDVNTEVQKRGRINRTGMVNYPNYIYAISRIPSEIRRLLMLVRKLRSLDANTTANQKQSAKLSAIRDSFGNPIEDVINKYGDECLQEFTSDPNNEKYVGYMPTNAQEVFAGMSGSYVIESFVRNLEIGLSDEQEYFYNTINALYIALKTQLEEAGQFDLETNIIDLKASIKTRVLVSKGLNTNPFNASVYEEDDYSLAEDKPYNKEKVEDLIRETAKGNDPQEFYENFLTDYKRHFKEVHIKDVVDSVKVPDYEKARDEMEKMKMEAEYNLKVKSAINRAQDDYDAVLSIIDARDKQGNLILKPNKAAVIPAVHEECYETDEEGLPYVPKDFNNAKFIGVRLLNTAKEKYSPMNIELLFCQLSGKPKIILKPTARGRQILEWVIVKTKDIEIPRLVKINNWEVDENKRTIIRLFTGNILGAYGIAKDVVSRDKENYSPVIQFLKFTTADQTSLRLGIKIHMKKFRGLIPAHVPIQYPLNSPDLVTDLRNTKMEVTTVNGEENFYINAGDGYLQVRIFGGLAASKKEAKVKKYFSPLYNDGELVNMIESSGIYLKDSNIYYHPVGGGNRKILKFIGFDVNLNSKSEEVKRIFEYIYSKNPFNLPVTGVENEETIYDKIDLFTTELDNTDTEREGIFGYDTLRPYETIKDAVSSFSKFNEHKKTSAFGTVYLKKRASIKEAIAYGLIPLDNNIVEMVSDTFQALNSDSEIIKLKEDIAKAVSENKSNFQIGSMISKALSGKVLTLKNIFGYDAENLDFVGQVFKSYAKGEVELPEKEKKDNSESRDKMPERELDMDTAQEFMILLSYKIKN